jgi:hypothetical protein
VACPDKKRGENRILGHAFHPAVQKKAARMADAMIMQIEWVRERGGGALALCPGNDEDQGSVGQPQFGRILGTTQ